MVALTCGVAAPLVAQNIYLENQVDCDYTVRVRYADVNCIYDYVPPIDPPVLVCDPNLGTITYNANAQTSTNHTTPSGSKICSVQIMVGTTSVVTCSCAQQSCNVDDYPCGSGFIDIDVTVAENTTTIKWLP